MKIKFFFLFKSLKNKFFAYPTHSYIFFHIVQLIKVFDEGFEYLSDTIRIASMSL